MVAKFACSCSNQDLQKKTKKCLSAHKDLTYSNDILLYAIEREVIKLSLTRESPRSPREILRYSQDDTTPRRHPERSEGSEARIRPANLTHVALRTSGQSPGTLRGDS